VAEPPQQNVQKPKPPPAEPVIPLVHAPDDPGPGSGLDGDPIPEPASQGDAWHRIKQLFR
jgi:hypothetical protein